MWKRRVMKNSVKKNLNIVLLFIFSVILNFSISHANAQTYTKVNSANISPAPSIKGETRFGANGQEAAPNAYGYITNLPNDGNWRYIEPRCYKSSEGNVCVDGHWVRKKGNACEETTSHSVKQGNYTRIVNAGSAASCRTIR